MSDLLNKASLVVIPSGYKEDTVYSVVPSDGSGDLSFTRASNGTRINSAGLVEVVPWNLLQYSEDFTNAYWTKALATITANATTAPNGTTTADRVQISNSARGVVLLIDSTTAGTTLTFSLYAKANGQNLLRLFCDQTCVYFQGGTIVTLTNEWVRYSLTVTATQTGNIVFGFDNVSDSTTTCNGTNGTTDCFVWGAQLNIGSTAKPYFPTTDRLNVPRLTYQNGGGGCPSLLLEKQSTNEVQYSQELDNAYWFKYQGSITANQGISPDGTQNADLWTTSGSQSVLYRTGFTCNVLSYFAKAVSLSSGSKFYIQVDGVGNAEWNQDGTLSSVSGGTATNGQNMGNGWFRFAYIVTSGNVANYGLNGNTSTSTALFWGLQNEAGTYPTSYIPTTSSSATRVADACFKTGISSLIGQTEGTLFFELQRNDTDNDTRLQISDGSGINWLFVSIETGLNPRAYCNVGGVNQFSVYGSAVSNSTHKVALAYKSNDFKVYIDGVAVITQTSGSVPACNRIDVGSGSPNGPVVSTSLIKEVVLFKTRLTNAELASLTTI